jgi:hypothetical protein
MMKNETFRTIVYSDPNLFTQTNNQIALKEYADNVVLYDPFDANLNAKYSYGNPIVSTTENPIVMNFGEFAQCADLQGSITFDPTNFATLSNQGSIKFWLKATFNHAHGQQNFITGKFSTPFTAGTYGFTLTVGTNAPVQVSFDLVGTEDFSAIFSNIGNNLPPTAITNNTLFGASQTIQIRSVNLADGISITPPSSGLDLIALLGDVGPSLMLNAPSYNTTLFSLAGANNNNRIDLVHEATTSNLLLSMYDNNGVLVVNSTLGAWSNYYTSFYSFELDFNDTMAQLFIDGKLFGMVITNFSRQTQSDGAFVLSWNGADVYYFDELIIYNVYQHIQNYTPEITALTQYTTTVPYIDVDFGTGFIEGNISGMSVDASSNTDYVIQLGNQWYYYFSGAWYPSDGSFSQSVSASILETEFANLFFIENLDLTVRVYFESDGITPAYINDISIQTVNDASQQAMIFGSVTISGTVDLSVNNTVMISTDQTSYQSVNLASQATNPSAVTIQQIESAINSANIAGLAPAKDDGNGHLVLESVDTGIQATVAITNGATNDALPLVWGTPTGSVGTDALLAPLDYSPIYNYIRSRLGAPIVPVELSDEQLGNLLSETITEFNRWRNYKEDLLYMTLPPGDNGGYAIPPIIGDPNNIIDVVVRPAMPFGYFAADSDMAGNLFMQYLFQKFGRPGQVGFLSDYWLALSTETDMNLILGTTPRWEIINDTLFITPTPSGSLQIGIKYRASLTVNEILSDNLVKRYLLALSKILLGNIRNTFGGVIPGGTENIQLNGADLVRQGEQELEKAETQLIQQAEPVVLLLG